MSTRIAGIDIPENKPIKIALTAIYGVGRSRALHVLALAKVDPDLRAPKVPSQKMNQIRDLIEKKQTIEGDLRRERLMNIKRLKEIGSYRGMRHQKGLPVRGQQTKTNSRTVRGNVRRTTTSGKRPPASPT